MNVTPFPLNPAERDSTLADLARADSAAQTKRHFGKRITMARIGFDRIESNQSIDLEAAIFVLLGLCGLASVGYALNAMIAVLVAH